MLHRLIANWVYGGFLAGLLLLVLTSTLTHSWPAALTATYLCLPIYMLHQYEEHDDDRFRQFFNGIVGNGRRGLSLGAVFLINVPAVWGAIGISLALAASVNIGFGLIAVYLLLINALVHIAHAIAYRGYNPGLGTAIALFLPVGGPRNDEDQSRLMPRVDGGVAAAAGGRAATAKIEAVGVKSAAVGGRISTAAPIMSQRPSSLRPG